MKNKYLLLGMLLSGLNVLAQNPLFIPDTLSGSEIRLNFQNGSKSFYPGALTQTMGINGDLLGPTLILRKHQNITLHVKNQISDTTTLHWHGMHVAPENDGGPHVMILPGQTWSPSFEVLDKASTHWYHPHMHRKTHAHVQLGVAGFIIVRDSQEAALALPRNYGVDDIPLVIQTKALDAGNQIITTQTALDTTLLINGTLRPYFNAPAQIIRLRLLNGSSERVYNLGFNDNRTFHQIGSDGGLLTAPVAMSRLLLAPGERAEILLNLNADSGKTVLLMNFGSSIPNAHYGAAQPGMGPGQTIPSYNLNPLNGADFTLLSIRAGARTANAITVIPSTLAAHNPWPEASADITRNLTFMSMTMGPGAINGPFVINNAHFDMDVINYRVPFNNTEIWELRNQTPIAHPFHIHNVQFYVLSINGAMPPAHLRGKKDVILVPGGNGVVRFITRFEDFHNDTLPYMYHCHMLTHEDHGMMGQFVVESPCSLITAQPQNQYSSAGGNVRFEVAVGDTAGTVYQWQSNIGFGFQDLQNAGQYSGVNTAVLTVSALASFNHLQQFRCKVSNPNCSVVSDIAVLSLSSGLSERFRKDLFSVFPNPATQSILIRTLENSGPAVVSILDALGRELLKFEMNEREQSILLNTLPAGIYHIRMQSAEGMAVQPFVKD